MRDFDVECAEKARVADPKVDLVYEGNLSSLAVFETIDGRLHVAWGDRTTAVQRPILQRHLSGEPLGTLQLPRVDVSCTIGSAVVEDGGGVVFGSDPGGFHLLVLERAESGPSTAADLEIVPIGSVVTPPLSAAVPSVRPRGPGESFELDAEYLGAVDEPRVRYRRVAQTLVIPPRDVDWRVLWVGTAGDRDAVALVRVATGG